MVSFYQIFVGLGDALPVPLLMLLIYRFYFHKDAEKGSTYIKKHLKRTSKTLLSVTVSTVFIIERIICYSTGITLSAMKEYPVPCMIWTIVFGIILGIVCTILYPIYDSIGNNKKQSVMLMILTLGLNWIWFNNFIAMLAKDMVLQMTTRSCIDVAAIICCIIAMKGKMRYEEV
ncbi:MAG: hypothetical protein PUC65_12610 [Clostridiales bacterium]|nr:hypothetical protein [Clostridiales bacterium]